MNNWFYSRLALSNIRKNSQTYVPYILAASLTIMMFYIIAALSTSNELIKQNGFTLSTILSLGTVIVGFFAVIFLFYTNSFIIKQRKKEIGLYNILGMEKKHIARMMLMENFYVALIAITLGIALGILFSKLVVLMLFKIVSFDVPTGFEISVKMIIVTIVLFCCIFALTLITNLYQIHLAQPIELLRGGQTGEREPRTKWLLMLIGAVSLGSGYYIALTRDNPLSALKMFFFAVILVMIGTYCLFTAGSIGLLKMLRRNKRFYYQPRHFINISGMIYRMKKNAVGLANICILGTMVLVTISTTVSLYVGFEDVMRARYPRNMIITANYSGEKVKALIRSTTADVLKNKRLEPFNILEYRYLPLSASQNGSVFLADRSSSLDFQASMLYFIPLEDYNRMANQSLALADDEVLIYAEHVPYPYTTLTVFDQTFTIKDRLNQLFIDGTEELNITTSYYLIVKDLNVLKDFYERKQQAYGSLASPISYVFGFDIDTSDEEGVSLHWQLKNKLISVLGNTGAFRLESAAEARHDFYSLYGGLFFLGIFLGLLFLLAAVLIIYYKQITEGYDDQQRFQIMQQMGMSQDEVKQAIRTQVLMVFFIPLIMAAVHVAFAFKVIRQLLALFSLTNAALFAGCTAATLLVFALLYTVVYIRTARVYYRIVSIRN